MLFGVAPFVSGSLSSLHDVNVGWSYFGRSHLASREAPVAMTERRGVTVRRSILPPGSELSDRARPAWHIELSGPSTKPAAS